MVKMYNIPKQYYINGIIANEDDLNRLYFDYFCGNVEILEIISNANFVEITTI